MAKIQVTATDTNSFLNAARTEFRSSSGIPYSLSLDETNNDIEVYKGNSTTPTSYSLADSITAETDPVGISGAIDSDDIIKISWLDDAGKASPLRYAEFDCDTDTFNTPVSIVVDIGEDPTAANLYTAIAIDSNDVPHIVYNEYQKIGGVSTYVAKYVNKVGGSWNTPVNVDYIQNANCKKIEIAIDLDNIPFISLLILIPILFIVY